VQGDRRRGGSRTRILYWFHTPPGVKVGRSLLDPETRRTIEALYPDLEFDWPRILKGQSGTEAGGAAPRNSDQERRKRPRESRPSRVPETQTGGRVEPAESAPPIVQTSAAAEVDKPVTVEAPAPVETAPLPDLIIAAHAILGAEGVQRLRRRYADLSARIAGRVQDEEQQQRLKEQCDRLNPDTWLSEDDVRRALEQYEAILESIRAVVGQPRRRRRPDDGAEDRGSESV
jgi:hypothetical protein